MTKIQKTELLDSFKAFLKSKDCELQVRPIKDKFHGLPPLVVIEVTRKSGNGDSTICYQVMEYCGSDDDCCIALLEALCAGRELHDGVVQVERFDAIGLKRPGSLQELALTLAAAGG